MIGSLLDFLPKNILLCLFQLWVFSLFMVYFLWERHIITSLEMFGFYSCVNLGSFLISGNLMMSQEENKI